MLFQIKRVKSVDLYRLHDDVLSFFESAINDRKFSKNLFTADLWNVLTISNKLNGMFKRAFNSLPISSRARRNVYDYLVSYDDIEALCNSTAQGLSLNGSTYAKILFELKGLYEELWASISSLKEIEKRYGDIKKHYTEFFNLNCTPTNICPFCGIEKYVNPAISRSDYDHYLCKASYVQSAINFENLVPMPDRCNKAPNKGGQDMLFDSKKRSSRIAHFPYANVPKLRIQVSCADIFGEKEKWIVLVSVGRGRRPAGLTTWKSVFKIEERWSIEIQENKNNWLNNFYSHFMNDLPSNLTELRSKIGGYISYLKGQSKTPGWFLGIAFWNYCRTLDTNNLKLLLTHLKEMVPYKTAA